jgi:hypothetical protein
MNPEEIQALLDKKFEQTQKDLADAQKNNASKDEILKLTNAIKEQGGLLEDIQAAQKKRVVKGLVGQFHDFLTENKSKLEEIKNNKSGEIEFIPKVVADITTGSGSDIDTPPLDVSTSLGHFNLRNDNNLLALCTQSSTNSPSHSYTEMLPKEGGYAFVAEGGTKPQIDWKWENRYAAPKKAAAYEILTEESVTDYARLMSVAKEYLTKQHDLFKANAVYFGDGTGENPTGATVYGRTFVSTSMVDVFPLGGSNFMDVVNAIITDIYRTQAFTDEAHYMPNIVLINPIDFFVQLVGAKDGNGLPLYPQAGLFNEVRIGGVRIKPWIKIPAGKVFVADMSKYNIVNYVPFSIRLGWINDQFITNKFTMVGESRFYAYVKNLDQAAFVYDDISTVQAAITAAV